MSAAEDDRAWLVVGAPVAVIIDHRRVAFDTITRIGKRDVVTEGGHRVNVDTLTRRTGGPWDGQHLSLRPAGDRDAQRMDARNRLANVRRNARRLVDGLLAGWDDGHPMKGEEALGVLSRHVARAEELAARVAELEGAES